MEETSVAKKTAFHVPNSNTSRTKATETALPISHQIIAFLGFIRSAHTPPMKEKINIGANSATDIRDTANALPFVFSITNIKTAKFLTQIPSCKKIMENRTPTINRFRNSCPVSTVFFFINSPSTRYNF
ncbi:hypothetical protein D3C81_1493700 [compost metagenome]